MLLPMLVDTHCHIQSIGLASGERSTRELWAKSDLNVSQVLQNAQEAGVTKMICVGCDFADSELAVQFVQDKPECWASIGLHPHEAAEMRAHKSNYPKLAALVHQPKVVAIGECGLDYYYNHSPKADQVKVLEFQLQLAKEADLPIIFHVREAFDDFWPIYDNTPVRGVLHSFTDSKANLDKALQRGLFIGVNGIATFAKSKEQINMYKSIPPEHLLLETDAPFLTPTPNRGKINEPKQIVRICEFLAELKGIDHKQLGRQTSKNAAQLFDI